MMKRTTVLTGAIFFGLMLVLASETRALDSFFDIYYRIDTPGIAPGVYPDNKGSVDPIDVNVINDGSTTSKLKFYMQNTTEAGLTPSLDTKLEATDPAGATMMLSRGWTRNFTVNSFFDIYMELFNADGITPRPITQVEYLAPDSFFDVFLESPGAPGLGQDLHLQFSPLQNLALGETLVTSTEADLLGGILKARVELVGTGSSSGPVMAMNLTGTVVPEPSTLALLGIGAVSLAAYAWRRGWPR